MKLLATLTLLSALSVVVAAQNNIQSLPIVEKKNAPDIEITSGLILKTDQVGNTCLSITVKNIGSRAITRVDWRYDSVEGTAGFTHYVSKINPEQTNELLMPMHSQDAMPFIERMKIASGGTLSITHLIYDDGSEWKLPCKGKQ
jgi:hypothetical protein